ncbi:MAG TPA: hypothetical protein P5084_05140 [Paludibacter sp.]|nr:hypothetical protein [Paludibacter sp.]
MNLREQLKNPDSLGYIDIIIQNTLEIEGGFEELFSLFFDEEKDVAWRAGWACDKISRKHPELFTNTMRQKIVAAIPHEKHNGTLRALLSLMNNFEIPENISVELINKLFDWMISSKSDVSHQVLSMKILGKFCDLEPGLIPELLAYLENVNSQDYTPGFNSVKKKMINHLKNKSLKI